MPSSLDDNVAITIRGWLPQDEIDKVDRYIQQSAQVQGLMVRGYLRAILSQHGTLKPNEWQFEYGEKGKPRLTPAQFALSGIDFNLSHSGDWLLLAIYQQPLGMLPLELGVDIERCRSRTNIHSILNHYFSEPETTALLALPSERQRDRFFDLWALKESYIKAKGLGLALSLKSFGFDLSVMKQSTLILQSSEKTPPELQQTGFTEQMLFKQQVGLQFFAKQSSNSDNTKLGADKPIGVTHANVLSASEADTWHCALGHLNDEYRFAISIDGQAIVADSIEYQAQMSCINTLVLTYS
ncbi:4'-phosphopantetheinyl transferase superfamily protein [Shewanella sp. 10N.286.54.B9]|uniref:4'-phosphopantetheinyl transferase family protein n=1 Tax=Shewanella sp. 10N.286.54.B9 TaxID=3229719 RepID=UPI00354B13BF